MGVQSVGRDHDVSEREGLEQFFEFWDFVGFFLHRQLADNHCLLMEDGAEQMRGPLSDIMSATEGFAVYRDSFACQRDFVENPFSDLGIEFFCVDALKDTTNGWL